MTRMRKEIQRIIAVIAVCSVACPMMNRPVVYAENKADIVCTVENGVYKISGSSESDYANVVIMSAEADSDEITGEILSLPDYISFSAASSNGSFSKSFALPQNLADGEYKSVVWSGSNKIEIYFIKGDESFKNSLIEEKLKNDKLDEVVERYGQNYGIDKSGYASLKDSVKSEMKSELKNVSVTDFSTQYKECLLKTVYSKAETTDNIYSILVMLDTDFTYYNKLNSDEQQLVLLKLLKNLPDSVNDLKPLAQKYSREAYDNRNSGNGSGSGSGSSGGGSSSKGPSAGSSIISDKYNTGNVTTLPDTSGTTLSDISEHWAKESIENLAKRGIVSGSDDGKFYPDNNITRAEFAKMLAIASGIKTNSANVKEFTDVSSNAWYYEYVASLSSNGIINGYDDGSFCPDNKITRQEMAVILYRILENKGISFDKEVDFSDADSINEYAREAVAKLSGAGILSGSEGKFRPTDNLTRAEGATATLKMLNKLEGKSVSDTENSGAGENKNTLIEKSEMTKNEVLAAEAQALIPKLINHEMRGVTRAGFIADVYELANQGVSQAKEQYFEDLPLSRAETSIIQSAADMGYISKGGNFRPDDIITKNEAVQIMVSVLGYGRYAEAAGGWPSGYIAAAQKADLYNKVENTAGSMDETSAAIMLLNMLHSRVVSWNSSTEMTVSEKTLLEQAFGLYSSSGIVSETQYNSLKRTGIDKQNTVIIGDKKYFSKSDETDFSDFIGDNVSCYYNDDDELFLLVKNEKNKTVRFPIEDAELQDAQTISYTENGKKYRYKVEQEYSLLYNGALSKRTFQQILGNSTDGTVELLDNDNDGKYDVIFIRKPEYMVVDNISKTNKLIYDKNSSDNVIDLSNDDTIFRIEGRGEKQIRLLDVTAGETYEIYTTEDRKLIGLKVMEKLISGRVDSVSVNSNEITVDGIVYKTTDYFNKYYAALLKPGSDYSFTAALDGKLISYSDVASEMQYGFVKSINWEDGQEGESLNIRIFSENGKFENYIINSKIAVDSQSAKVDDLYNKLAPGGQIIQYKASGDKLLAIDTAQVSDGMEAPGTKKKDGNSLTEYKFAETTYYYKDNVDLMYPYFNVSGTIVFAIPNDLSDTDRYRVTNSSYFADGTNYSNLKVYNLSESGTAEAVFVRSDSTTPAISKYVNSFVVEKITTEVNADDEITQRVYGWMDNKYRSYYIDESVSLYKASGETLGFGDVIRFYSENDVIKRLICDFDANEEVFARNNITDAGYFNEGNKDVCYQLGRVYSINNGFIYMGSGENGEDMTISGLRNFSANVSNIAIINRATKEVRTGTLSDIKTYKNYGKGDMVLIKQRNLLSTAIYVYEDGEE